MFNKIKDLFKPKPMAPDDRLEVEIKKDFYRIKGRVKRYEKNYVEIDFKDYGGILIDNCFIPILKDDDIFNPLTGSRIQWGQGVFEDAGDWVITPQSLEKIKVKWIQTKLK